MVASMRFLTFALLVIPGWAGWFSRSNPKNPISVATEDISELLERNEKWANEIDEKDPDFFHELAYGQHPKYLYIGCADSRIPSNEILGLGPGEVFVHRNVANVVANGDTNLLAVLQYAVEVLQVEHILLVGHYGCGGVQAADTAQDYGKLEGWLKGIRDVKRLHRAELRGLADPDEHLRRLVELNVEEQCINLLANPIVQKARREKGGFPTVQGLVFDMETGRLTWLSPEKIQAAYAEVEDCYQIY